MALHDPMTPSTSALEVTEDFVPYVVSSLRFSVGWVVQNLNLNTWTWLGSFFGFSPMGHWSYVQGTQSTSTFRTPFVRIVLMLGALVGILNSWRLVPLGLPSSDDEVSTASTWWCWRLAPCAWELKGSLWCNPFPTSGKRKGQHSMILRQGPKSPWINVYYVGPGLEVMRAFVSVLI